MKKFSQINEARKAGLELQENTINYISKEDLEKYLTVADKFISPETKEICKWLIVNNVNYLHDLDPSMSADNALAAFYNKGIPSQEDKKELYSCVGKVIKAKRILEIPVFQTREQFEAIINKKVSPDEILLDLESERGKSEIAKKYEPMLHKIVNQYLGKANLSYEELMSAAYEGLTYAMHTFGKPKKRDENGKWVDSDEKTEQQISYKFSQYAGFCIRNFMLAEIEGSHIVRVPKSAQKRERDEQGHNIKKRHISGDETVGSDSEGKGKTLFDYIEDVTDSGAAKLDNEDIQKFFKTAYKRLEDKFGEDFTIFCRIMKINGYENETKNSKELGAEYGIKPSTLSVRMHKILDFCRSDKQLSSIFGNIRELMAECRQRKYEEEDQFIEERKLGTEINIDD